MLWAEQIPRHRFGPAGRQAVVSTIAGQLPGAAAALPAPPPASWAAAEAHGVAIWTIQLERGPAAVLGPRCRFAHLGLECE